MTPHPPLQYIFECNEKIHKYPFKCIIISDFQDCNTSEAITIGNGICEDDNNNLFCFFDFGDCCRKVVNDSKCSDCECKQFPKMSYEEKFENISRLLSKTELKQKMAVTSN